MSLDIFFSEDIRNALLAADEAAASTARACAVAGGDVVAMRAYLEGYRAALATVALAFGLEPISNAIRIPMGMRRDGTCQCNTGLRAGADCHRQYYTTGGAK